VGDDVGRAPETLATTPAAGGGGYVELVERVEELHAPASSGREVAIE
jgi:hypothetical protein